MADDRWSAWDLLRLPYVGFHEAYLPKGESVESMRAKCRTEVVNRFVSLKESDAPRREIEAESLAKEIVYRRHYWGRRSAHLPNRKSEINPQKTLVWRLLVIVFSSLGVTALVVAGAWPTAVLVGLVAIGLLYWLFKFRGRLTGEEVLRTRRCPDCSYQLGDLRPEVDPAVLGGLWIGPKACPECGSPWPFVPPPVFE